MGLVRQDEEVDYLLSQIDPYKNKKMTYSEIVQLLSSHMVPSNSNPTGPADAIPILEKFSLSSVPDPAMQEQDAASNPAGTDALPNVAGDAIGVQLL